MNMKLSYRDKVIFIVVMVILVLVAGFFLIIKPKFENVDVAKYNMEQVQAKEAEIKAKIDTLPTIIESMKESAKAVGEIQDLFLEEGHPYVNENYIRESLNEIDIDIATMETQYTVAGPIEKYVVDAKNILAYQNKMDADLYNELPQEVYDVYNKVQKEKPISTIIGVTTMKVEFNSDIMLEDAFAVIDKIAEDEKAIILNTIGSGEEGAEDATTRKVTATITLYSIFPLNVEEVLKETDEIKPLETVETPAA